MGQPSWWAQAAFCEQWAVVAERSCPVSSALYSKALDSHDISTSHSTIDSGQREKAMGPITGWARHLMPEFSVGRYKLQGATI